MRLLAISLTHPVPHPASLEPGENAKAIQHWNPNSPKKPLARGLFGAMQTSKRASSARLS